MKKRFFVWLCILAMLLALPVYAADSGAGTMLYRHQAFIAPELTYHAAVYAGDAGAMQAGYCLELEPNGEVRPIVMACDTMYGGLTMDEAIAYTEGMGYNVVGAVNTAFYNSPGIPIGIVVENGGLRSAADGLNAFAILPDGSYYAAHAPKVRFALQGELWEDAMELQYLNKGMSTEDIYIYTEDFSTVSTRVTERVWAVRMQILEGELTLSGALTLEVTEVLPQTGEVPIGKDTLILTARTNGINGNGYARFAVGDRLTLETKCADEKLAEAGYITGCGDILAENGMLTEESTWSPFVAGSHPRTLVGWRSDGTLVMYVADGRRAGYANGLTQRQAGEEMLRRACQTVVNMDGGGSSIIGVRQPGQWYVSTLNRPSDGAQRQNAAYLMLVTEKKADGKARYWHLRENGTYVLPNQKIDLHAFATDAGLYPAAADAEGLLYSTLWGISREPVYRAAAQSGLQKISLFGKGASGEGSVRVVTSPTRLYVAWADGRPLGDLVVENGQSLPLHISGEYNGVPIAADESCVTYEMSAPLGAADENGVFTVNALHGTEGTLTMHIADRSYTVQLRVVPSLRDYTDHRCKTALDFYLAG